MKLKTPSLGDTLTLDIVLCDPDPPQTPYVQEGRRLHWRERERKTGHDQNGPTSKYVYLNTINMRRRRSTTVVGEQTLHVGPPSGIDVEHRKPTPHQKIDY